MIARSDDVVGKRCMLLWNSSKALTCIIIIFVLLEVLHDLVPLGYVHRRVTVVLGP